jgi:hypothetical protein
MPTAIAAAHNAQTSPSFIFVTAFDHPRSKDPMSWEDHRHREALTVGPERVRPLPRLGDRVGEQTEEKQAKDGNKCPECGEPVEDLRATCANCGYEYKDEDYSDPEKGNEFLSGSNVDDEGEEITDEGPGVEEGAE